jgi:hypothetical protein
MADQPVLMVEGADLERAVEDRVRQYTGGRLRRLRVEVAKGRVIVHGYAPSDYVKQLALQAVLAVTQAGNFLPVEMHIAVVH